MKLVIEIPKEYYDELKKYKTNYLENKVAEGIPIEEYCIDCHYDNYCRKCNFYNKYYE